MRATKKKIPTFKLSIKTVLFAGICITIAGLGSAYYLFKQISKETPEITKVSDYKPLGVTQIISTENGQSKVMAEFFKEKRYLTPYDQIPKKLVQAFLSAEDSTFFEHQGVNFLAIARAAIANFLAGQVVQGGSTITQQIAKSLYLSPDRNIIRKVRELFVSFQLEKTLSKEEILYLYLNQIYLGSGAYGVQAAAKTYFHKDVKTLSVAEMALIAGLPTAPGKFSPLLNPKKAKERQLYVLKRMKENHFITDIEQKKAAMEKVRIYVNDGTEQKLAPHFVEHLRRYLSQKYGEKALYEEGMTIVVPAALKYYEYASSAVESGLEEIDQQKGYRGPIKNIPPVERDQFKADQKKEITKELFPYRYLVEDGSLDLESAIQEFDPSYEKSILRKKFKAVVTQVIPERKIAYAHIGLAQVYIPFEQVEWAHPVDASSKKPKQITEVLKEGDVVWVKILSSGSEGWKARLIQIPEVEGALYSVDIETGQILAMVGGYNFDKSQFNRAVQAKRQVGSTFKPIIYSAGLEKGLTPASIIVDSPVVFEDAETGTWRPENYEEKFYGDTTFRQALINSRNIPTIKIVQDLKVSNVIEAAKRFGLEGPFNQDLSISLGSANASLQDMVHTFTAFPLQGKSFQPVLFEKIIDRDGRVLETNADRSSQDTEKNDQNEKTNPEEKTAKKESNFPFVPTEPGMRMDPRVAYVMTHLMKEVVQFGTAARANIIGKPIAGKTGTTQDFRDGWFIGFSPRVVTGVWVGYDDQHSMGHGETGASTALPIWTRYMQNVLRDYPSTDFPIPDGVTFVSIDSKTGKRSEGARSIKEAFIAGTEPGSSKVTIGSDSSGKSEVSLPDADDDTLREEN
jgi:penicillin-binding protein 1A